MKLPTFRPWVKNTGKIVVLGAVVAAAGFVSQDYLNVRHVAYQPKVVTVVAPTSQPATPSATVAPVVPVKTVRPSVTVR